MFICFVVCDGELLGDPQKIHISKHNQVDDPLPQIINNFTSHINTCHLLLLLLTVPMQTILYTTPNTIVVVPIDITSKIVYRLFLSQAVIYRHFIQP